MARQVQIIKGTTAQNEAFTGAEGALSYDSQKKNLHVHDGETEGGFEIPSSAMADYVIYWDSADSTDHSHAKPGVSTPTDHGWYRLYKSGWVEQGGIVDPVTPGSFDFAYITLPIQMQGTKFTVVVSPMIGATVEAFDSYNTICVSITSATEIKLATLAQTLVGISWNVAGMTA